MSSVIPLSVISAVSDVLPTHYASHAKLNRLFETNGAPGTPPEGNLADKVRAWLKRCNDELPNSCEILGHILQDFMDGAGHFDFETQEASREKIKKVLAENGLSYDLNGQIIASNKAISTIALEKMLRSKNLPAVDQEFKRTLQSVEQDPPAALTAACAIVESLCKIYIEDNNLTMPAKETIKPLWDIVSKHLGFDPRLLEDDDMKRILTGLTSIVDGLGAFRTHAGSAHGKGRKPYRVKARHARLTINAAHTICIFVIESWSERQKA